jgi:hypothetical protein
LRVCPFTQGALIGTIPNVETEFVIRIGMHLLFYGKEQVKLLEHNRTIEKLLKEQSIKVRYIIRVSISY